MSDYVPTDWVDNVTPVDAARMDHIEAGIDVNRDAVIDHETRIDSIEAGKENKSEKGAVNGYAPLGSDTKVPSIYLPAGGGGGGVDYDGAWAAGTPYVQGDVVLYNGVEYIAVNPSTGQTPPALIPATPAQVPLVTTLPASPFDGQTVDFTDSLTTPSYVWRFRYVASAPSNKWKFVGGAPVWSVVDAIEAVTAVSVWADAATLGPTFTVPLAGDYYFAWSATASSATTNILVYSALAVGTATPFVSTVQMIHTVGGLGWNHTFGSHFRAAALAAGNVIRMRYQNPNETHWGSRRLSVIPVAVS